MELLPLFALIAPLILWPVETLLPYPHIIEELAKAALVWPLLGRHSTKSVLISATLIGLAFTISESVLYLFNIFATGTLQTLFSRLLLTAPLHVTTTLIIAVFGHFNRRLVPIGLLLAILLHTLFNTYLAPNLL